MYVRMFVDMQACMYEMVWYMKQQRLLDVAWVSLTIVFNGGVLDNSSNKAIVRSIKIVTILVD